MQAVTLAVLALAALATSSPVIQAPGNLMEEARTLGLDILTMAVRMADLYDTLATGGPFTIFAPTDAAFHALPKHVINDLMKDKTKLADLLKYHVVMGKVMSSDLKNEQLAKSLNGANIRINIYMDGKVITATGSQVTMPNKMASNGVIHVIDRVMYPIPMGTVVDAVKAHDMFSTLLTAVLKAELADTLAGPGPFTVFAPTNEAFKKLPVGALDKLLKDKTALTNVLKYHVVSGTVYSKGLTDGASVPTLNGQKVMVKVSQDGVMINDASVTMANVSVTNGVIHVIDKVLLPSKADFRYDVAPNNLMMKAESLGLHALVWLVRRAGLYETLSTGGPFTLFAPTDMAFMQVPPMVRHLIMRNRTLFIQTLKYHVTSGSVMSTQLKNELLAKSLAGLNIRINIYKDGKVITASGSQVTNPDQRASNGIIHVVDRVMFPLPMENTLDLLKMDPHLSTLLKAVTAAGLGDVLTGPGPFTVFAPNDMAFAKIPKEALDKLLQNKTALTNVIKSHVVSGTVYSKGLSDGQMVTTLSGAQVKVTITAKGVMINDAGVTFPDVSVTNGVVHIIDTVLLPKPTHA